MYNTAFNPQTDLTVAFKYNQNTNNEQSLSAYGFGFFFVTGTTATLSGGGDGIGLGMVSSTRTIPASSIQGIYLAIGFDSVGGFSLSGAAPRFPTGNTFSTPKSICIRKNYSNLNYLSCIQPTALELFDLNEWHTLRINVRKMFQQIDVCYLIDNTFITVASFNTDITPNQLPASLKFGISYSGDAEFNVKDITANYS